MLLPPDPHLTWPLGEPQPGPGLHPRASLQHPALPKTSWPGRRPSRSWLPGVPTDTPYPEPLSRCRRRFPQSRGVPTARAPKAHRPRPLPEAPRQRLTQEQSPAQPPVIPPLRQTQPKSSPGKARETRPPASTARPLLQGRGLPAAAATALLTPPRRRLRRRPSSPTQLRPGGARR